MVERGAAMLRTLLRTLLLLLLVVVVALSVGQCARADQWYEALFMENDWKNTTMRYDSPVWEDGTPFGSPPADTMFAAYSTVYVSQIAVWFCDADHNDHDFDAQCVGGGGADRQRRVFEVPDPYKNVYTLQQLVTLPGGMELTEVTTGLSGRIDRDYAQNWFETDTLGSGVMCNRLGVNFGGSEDPTRSSPYNPYRARIGTTLSFPGGCADTLDGVIGVGLYAGFDPDQDYSRELQGGGPSAPKKQGYASAGLIELSMRDGIMPIKLEYAPADHGKFYFANVNVLGSMTPTPPPTLTFTPLELNSLSTFTLQDGQLDAGTVSGTARTYTYTFMARLGRTEPDERAVFFHGDSFNDDRIPAVYMGEDDPANGLSGQSVRFSTSVGSPSAVSEEVDPLLHLPIGRWTQVGLVVDDTNLFVYMDAEVQYMQVLDDVSTTYAEFEQLFQFGRSDARYAAIELSDVRYYEDQRLNADDMRDVLNEWEGARSACGDGYRARNEECDDSNSRDGDGCNSGCLIEAGYFCHAGNATARHPDECFLDSGGVGSAKTLWKENFENAQSGVDPVIGTVVEQNVFVNLSDPAVCTLSSNSKCGGNTYRQLQDVPDRCTLTGLAPHDMIEIDAWMFNIDKTKHNYFNFAVDDVSVWGDALTWVFNADEGIDELVDICDGSDPDRIHRIRARTYHTNSTLNLGMMWSLSQEGGYINITITTYSGANLPMVTRTGTTSASYHANFSRTTQLAELRNDSRYNSTLGLRVYHNPLQSDQNIDSAPAKAEVRFVIPMGSETLQNGDFFNFWFNYFAGSHRTNGMYVSIVMTDDGDPVTQARHIYKHKHGLCTVTDPDNTIYSGTDTYDGTDKSTCDLGFVNKLYFCPFSELYALDKYGWSGDPPNTINTFYGDECVTEKYYRICYSADYEMMPYIDPEFPPFCDERIRIPRGTWEYERIDLFGKLADKFGITSANETHYFLQIGFFAGDAGAKRVLEAYLDDLSVTREPPVVENTPCPALQAISTPPGVAGAGAQLLIDGIDQVAGPQVGFHVLALDPDSHTPDAGGVQVFNGTGFAKYVNTLSYGTVVMVASEGAVLCETAACRNAFVLLGGSRLGIVNETAGEPVHNVGVAMVGAVGAAPRTELMQVTLGPDDGPAVAESFAGCHFVLRNATNLAVYKSLVPGYGYTDHQLTYEFQDNSLGYLGCYRYGSNVQDDQVSCYSDTAASSTSRCGYCCRSLGYTYSVVYDSFGCFCNDVYAVDECTVSGACGEPSVSDARCDQPCSADARQLCGSDTGASDFYYRAFLASGATYLDSTHISGGPSCSDGAASCASVYDDARSTVYISDPYVSLPGAGYVRIVFNLDGAYNLAHIRILWDASQSGHAQSWAVGVREVGSTGWFWVQNVTDGWNNEASTNSIDGLSDSHDVVTPTTALQPVTAVVLDLKMPGSGLSYAIKDVRINIWENTNRAKYGALSGTSQTYDNLQNSYFQWSHSMGPHMSVRDVMRLHPKTGSIQNLYALFDFQTVDYYTMRTNIVRTRLNSALSVTVDLARADQFMELQHGVGSLPMHVEVTVTPQSGNNLDYHFRGTGMIGRNAPLANPAGGEQYGGILFAVNETQLRLWAPREDLTGHATYVKTGWAPSEQEDSVSGTVHVDISEGVAPDFDSGWLEMESQSQNLSQRVVPHDLGNLDDSLVRVWYRARDPAYHGYVFEASGSAQNDDNHGRYGGILYAYNDFDVYLWAPNRRPTGGCPPGQAELTTASCEPCITAFCTHRDGFAGYIPRAYMSFTGTMIASEEMREHAVEVRVAIWHADNNERVAFASDWEFISATNDAFLTGTHDVGKRPGTFKATVRVGTKPSDLRFDSVGAVQGDDSIKRQYGGIVAAVSDTRYRIWAPAATGNAEGFVAFAREGWGNGSIPIAAGSGSARVVMWENAVTAARDAREVRLGLAQVNLGPRPTSSVVEVVELETAGTIVVTIAANDPDSTDLTFKILSGNTNNAFAIDNLGQLTVANPLALDFETQPLFILRIEVSDGILSDVTTVTITVLDTNEIPQLGPPFHFTVAEASELNTPVGLPLNGSDVETDQSIIYLLEADGNRDNAFSINSCGGQLRVNNPDALDFERISGYRDFNLSIRLTDDGDNAGFSNHTITVAVTNVNEAPSWNSIPTLFVPENSPPNTFVANLTEFCRDPDFGDGLDFTVEYAFSVEFSTDLFYSDNETDTLLVQNNRLDYEDASVYTLLIHCDDKALLRDSANLALTVTDANDPPVFGQQNYSFAVREGTGAGKLLGTFTATDQDVNNNLKFSYTNATHATTLPFTIDEDSGELRTKAYTFSFANNESWLFGVDVTDDGILLVPPRAPNMTTTVQVSIQVTDVNQQPAFSGGRNFSVPEHSSIGTLIAQLNGSDPDGKANDDITFTLLTTVPISGDSLFSISNFVDTYSGDLLVADDIDFETGPANALYKLNLRLIDKPNNAEPQLTNDVGVWVTVLDRNDAPVVPCGGGGICQTLSVSENSPNGTVVAQLGVTDQDNDPLTYVLSVSDVLDTLGPATLRVNASGYMLVDVSPGRALDHEAQDSTVFRVTVSDSSVLPPGPQNVSNVFQVNIDNVNEAPIANKAAWIFGVEEGTLNGTNVGKVVFTDPDDGDTVTYSIAPTAIVYNTSVGGGRFTRRNHFGIDPASGTVFVVDQDTVALEVWTFQVFGTDTGMLNSSTDVNVTIADTNAPPTFTSALNCSVVESATVGDPVCNITTTDSNSGDKVTILGTGIPSQFNLPTAQTYTVLLVGVGALDFETVPFYQLSVTATDDHCASLCPLSTEVQLNVTVLDANDAPQAANATGFAVPEDATVGTEIGTVTFTDQDASTNLTFAVVNFPGLFSCTPVGPLACNLTSLGGLDFETVSSYAVKVSGNDGLATAVAHINVSVTNVNEAPIFTRADLYVRENRAAGTAVAEGSLSGALSVSVVDPEGDALTFLPDASAEFTLTGISPTDFDVTTDVVLDYEATIVYTFNLTIQDTSALSTRGVVVVHVVNENDVTVTSVVSAVTGIDQFTTQAEEPVHITGTNLGLVSGGSNFSVTYGPTGTEFAAKACVQSIPNTEILCNTTRGTGLRHYWTVTVNPGTWEHSTLTDGSNGTTLVTTGYLRPAISQVLVNGSAGRTDIHPSGSVPVVVSGTNLGDSSADSDYVFHGIVNLTDTGINNFGVSDVLEDNNYRCFAALGLYSTAVSDTVRIRCVAGCAEPNLDIPLTVVSRHVLNTGLSPTVARLSAQPCYIGTQASAGYNAFWKNLMDDSLGLLDGGQTCTNTGDNVILPGVTILGNSGGGAQSTKIRNSINGKWELFVKPYVSVAFLSHCDNTAGSQYLLRASGCTMTIPEKEYTCTLPPGVGANFETRVITSGLPNSRAAPAQKFSYHRPFISGLTGSGLTSLATLGAGIGVDTVTIVGAYFGSGSIFSSYGKGYAVYGPGFQALCSVSGSPQVGRVNVTGENTTAVRQELLCEHAPGVGANHSWVAIVGGQSSDASPDLTSYAPPKITSMPTTWPFSTTEGGDSVTINGQNFGPVTLGAGQRTIRTVYGRPSSIALGVGYEAVDCSVVVDDLVMLCETAEGTGFGHNWLVNVSNQASGEFAADSSYSPPLLQTFTVNESDPAFPVTTADYNTLGGEQVAIRGANFGPVPVSGEYKPEIRARAAYTDAETGDEAFYEARACNVTVAHFEIQCISVEGVGGDLAWTVFVDNQTNVLATTSYGTPEVHNVSGVGFNLSTELLDTAGGQLVMIQGANFGSDLTFLERVSYGPNGLPVYAMHDKQASNFGCNMTVPHQQLLCRTVAGVGQNHVFQLTVAGQRATGSGVVISYRAPIISSISPRSGVTRGEFTMTVKGQYFGSEDEIKVRFWGVDVVSDPSRDFQVVSDTEMRFLVPVGQGANQTVQVVHENAFCTGACSQGSTAELFSYVSPTIVTMSATEILNQTGSVTLTLRGLLSGTVNPKFNEGGSYSTGELFSWPPTGLSSVEPSVTLNNAVRVYPVVANASTAADLLGNPFTTCVVQAWDHDEITCIVARVNGSVVVDVNNSFSNVFTYTQLSPVVETLDLGGQNLSTKGGVNITIVGQYFGFAADKDVEVLLYMEDEAFNGKDRVWMDDVPCTPLVQRDISIPDFRSEITCTMPAGQGKNVAIKVRRLSSGNINVFGEGDGCFPCVSYPPPVIAEFSASGKPATVRRQRRRALGSASTSVVVRSDQDYMFDDAADDMADAAATWRWSWADVEHDDHALMEASFTAASLIPHSAMGTRARVGRNGRVQRLLQAMSFPMLVQTTGSSNVTILGEEFGITGGLQLRIGDQDNLTIIQYRPHAVSFVIPPGVGAGFAMSFAIANQFATFKGGVAALFFMNYEAPTVTTDFSNLTVGTRGGDNVTVHGLNFGEVDPAVVSTAFPTQSVPMRLFVTVGLDTTGFLNVPALSRHAVVHAWNHTSIVMEAPEGQGRNNDLELSVGGQLVTIPNALSYSPPSISSINPATGPTGGNSSSGAPIEITLTGDNFGTASATRSVTFNGEVIPSADWVSASHSEIVFYLPDGQGIAVDVTVTVESQTSPALQFSYLRPLLQDLKPRTGPTDACNVLQSTDDWNSELQTNPGAARKCLSKHLLTLTGENFGTHSMTVSFGEQTCVTDAFGEYDAAASTNGWDCMDCDDDTSGGNDDDPGENVLGNCFQSHNRIVIRAPNSFGVNKAVNLTLYGGEFNSSSATPNYTYDAPIVQRCDPGTARVVGIEPLNADGGETVTIVGQNFGGLVSDATVIFNKDTAAEAECVSAKWNKAAPEIADGLPYITCDFEERFPVGPQGLHVTVAEQSFNSIVDSRGDPFAGLVAANCVPVSDDLGQVTDFYGLVPFTEFCLPCPEGAFCISISSVDDYAAAYTDPVSQPGYWRQYFDVDSKDAKRQCDSERRTAPSQRTECPFYAGCLPEDSCTGSNTCEVGYEWLLDECRDKFKDDDGASRPCNTTDDCTGGKSCNFRNPENCQECIFERVDDPHGQCECVPSDRCALCTIYKYYRINDECEPCPKNVIVIITLFVLALVVFTMAGYVLNKKQFNSAFISIGFDYFQVLAVFSSSNVPWPGVIEDFFRFIELFSFNIDITAPECALPDFAYEQRWAITVCFPLIAGVLFLVMHFSYTAERVLVAGERGWNRVNNHYPTLVAMFVVMLYYLYLPLTRKILEVVNCNPAIPDDGYEYTEWTSPNCGGSLCRCWVAGEPQMQLLPYAVIFFLIYSIGFPVLAAFLVLVRGRKMKEDQLLRAMGLGDTKVTNPDCYDLRQKYHKLYYHFKPGKIYWILIILARKFWIALAALMFRSNPTFQLSFILLILFVSFVLQVKNRPFMSTVERQFEVEKHKLKVQEERERARKMELEGKVYVPSNTHVLIEQHLEVIEKQMAVETRRKKENTLENVLHDHEDVYEYFWDYNTVELSLLACAILVCISGIMFEAADDEDSSDARRDVTVAVLAVFIIFIIVLSLAYYFTVFFSEVFTTLGLQNSKLVRRLMAKDAGPGEVNDDVIDEEEFEMAAYQGTGENRQAKEAKARWEQLQRSLEDLQREHDQMEEQLSNFKKKNAALRSMPANPAAALPATGRRSNLKKKLSEQNLGGSTGTVTPAVSAMPRLSEGNAAAAPSPAELLAGVAAGPGERGLRLGPGTPGDEAGHGLARGDSQGAGAGDVFLTPGGQRSSAGTGDAEDDGEEKKGNDSANDDDEYDDDDEPVRSPGRDPFSPRLHGAKHAQTRARRRSITRRNEAKQFDIRENPALGLLGSGSSPRPSEDVGGRDDRADV